jgi:hypothetical protein
MGTIIANLKPGFTEARAQELTEGTLVPARFVEALVRIAATKTSAIGPDLHVVYVPQPVNRLLLLEAMSTDTSSCCKPWVPILVCLGCRLHEVVTKVTNLVVMPKPTLQTFRTTDYLVCIATKHAACVITQCAGTYAWIMFGISSTFLQIMFNDQRTQLTRVFDKYADGQSAGDRVRIVETVSCHKPFLCRHHHSLGGCAPDPAAQCWRS